MKRLMANSKECTFCVAIVPGEVKTNPPGVSGELRVKRGIICLAQILATNAKMHVERFEEDTVSVDHKK